MILIELNYRASIEQIDVHVADHVKFLEANYANGNFICSGRKNPRTGGIILTKLNSITKAKEVVLHDPFYIQQLAEYRFIDFTPSKYQPEFEKHIQALLK